MQHSTRFIPTDKCHPHFLRDEKATNFLIHRDALDRMSVTTSSLPDPTFLTVLEEDLEYPKLIDAINALQLNMADMKKHQDEQVKDYKEQCKAHAVEIATMRKDQEEQAKAHKEQGKAHQAEITKLKKAHEGQINKLVKSNKQLIAEVTALRCEMDELHNTIELYASKKEEAESAWSNLTSAVKRRSSRQLRDSPVKLPKSPSKNRRD